MAKHESRIMSLGEIINCIERDTDSQWYDVMGVEVPGLEEAKEIDGPDDFFSQSLTETEYIDKHESDMYEVKWPEHVTTPRFNSDACYLRHE